MTEMAFDYKISRGKKLSDVLCINYSQFTDFRGQIWTSFDKNLRLELVRLGIPEFIHDKFVKNKKTVLRGIHGDNKTWKLVTCVSGSIFQVVVDCRKGSQSSFISETFELNSEVPQSILIPPGYGNAFVTLSEEAIYYYKLAYVGEYADYNEQFTFKWNDARINIAWPIDEPILSERDQNETVY